MTDFSLIETMRWEPGTGIVRLRLHLARLKRSAGRLGFPGRNRRSNAWPKQLPRISPLCTCEAPSPP